AMLPSQLKPEHFNAYPPLARKLVVEKLPVLQTVPLSFLPSLLREVIEYDYKFPAERLALEKELANLASLSAEQREEWFREFAQRSEEHTSELQSRGHLVCRLLLEKKKGDGRVVRNH